MQHEAGRALEEGVALHREAVQRVAARLALGGAVAAEERADGDQVRHEREARGGEGAERVERVGVARRLARAHDQSREGLQDDARHRGRRRRLRRGLLGQGG